MNKRILLWGLVAGAFVVTLALTSGLNGLWHSAEPAASSQPPPARDNPVTAPSVVSTAPNPSPAAPTRAPEQDSAAAAAVPSEVAPDDPQYDQRTNPGVDAETIRRDRGVQRTSRSN